MSEEKSEAQIRNEEEVHRIMMERGYSSASNNKKHAKKVFGDDFPFRSIISGAIGAAVIIGGWVFLRNYIFSNNQYVADANIVDNADVAEKDADVASDDEYDNIEANNVNRTQKITNSETNDVHNTSQVTDRNIYYSYSDDDGTRHYTDGSTYNPHLCDDKKAEYDNAYQQMEEAGVEYDTLVKNMTPYDELYERAGKNLTLATQWANAEQQTVDNARRYYEGLMSYSNIKYSAWSDCKKEMGI